MRRWAVPSLVAIAVAGCSGGGAGGATDAAVVAGPDAAVPVPDAAAPDANPADLIPLSEAHFAATHNSYSGGTRGAIIDQLNAGVRFIELDIHNTNFATDGYSIGHLSPGNAVAHGGGNPDTNALPDWLAIVANFSASHPQAAPITLLLDIKDSLASSASYADGDLGRLGATLESAFGDRLYAADSSPGALPRLGQVRGRVLAVLSGDEATRLAYRRDRGHNAAVAVDGTGRVVEAHDSGAGALWYWTGQLAGDGSITWRRHTNYDSGTDPAIAIGPGGVVVEVHDAPAGTDNTLWYEVGRLGSDFEITWGTSAKFPGGDTGVHPSVRFTSAGALSVREIHESPKDGSHWYWNGTVDPNALDVAWSRNAADGGQTTDPLYDAARDQAGGQSVEVSTGAIGPYGPDTLRYRTSGDAWLPIRYRQIMFVEVQYGGNAALEADDGLWYYASAASSAGGRTWAEGWRSAGKLVRQWVFDSTDEAIDPAANVPATDTPSAAWYTAYCASIDCLQ